MARGGRQPSFYCCPGGAVAESPSAQLWRPHVLATTAGCLTEEAMPCPRCPCHHEVHVA